MNYRKGERSLRIFLALLKKLPHRAASRLGAALGWLLWRFSFKRVNRLESRCVAALGVGVTRAREIIRASYMNMGRVFAEFFNLKTRDEASAVMKISGENSLSEAYSKGKGVILMTAHLSNWEVGAAVVCARDFPLSAIYTPQRNTAGIEDIFREQRERVCGMKLVPSEGGGVKEAFRVLRRGEILVILQDLDARDDGVEMNFLGLPASVHIGIAKLARRFGSPIVPTRVVRGADGGLSVVFYPALQIEENWDMEKILSVCNNVMESWIKEYPEQWMWLLDRWRSRCFSE